MKFVFANVEIILKANIREILKQAMLEKFCKKFFQYFENSLAKYVLENFEEI